MTLVPRKLELELGACENDAVPTEPRELERGPWEDDVTLVEPSKLGLELPNREDEIVPVEVRKKLELEKVLNCEEPTPFELGELELPIW